MRNHFNNLNVNNSEAEFFVVHVVIVFGRLKYTGAPRRDRNMSYVYGYIDVYIA